MAKKKIEKTYEQSIFDMLRTVYRGKYGRRAEDVAIIAAFFTYLIWVTS